MGSGWTPEGESLLYQRLAQRGIDWMDYADVQRMAYYMYRSQAPMLFCGEDWGLANDVLEEIQI
jgi:1,4-alpha-glucan branching enzyme